MLIKYYKSNEQYNICYSSRNRFLQIPVSPFAQEVQKAIKLGDGSVTQIKTSVNNLCEYVTIDNTRWFVVSHLYLNSKQIILNLQRDVIGEMGISSCYGKVERGYTDTVLKKRKELQLNQILKDRKKLVPSTNKYGNYIVSNHINEMWGVLYLVKPSGIDPATGEKYPDKVNINIPAFAPEYVDLPFIPNGSIRTYGDAHYSNSFSFWIKFDDSNAIYNVYVNLQKNGSSYSPRVSVTKLSGPIDYTSYTVNIKVSNTAFTNGGTPVTYNKTESNYRQIAEQIGILCGNAVVNNPNSSNGYTFAEEVRQDNANSAYQNTIVKNGDYFYSYTLSDTSLSSYGNLGSSSNSFVTNYIVNTIKDKTVLIRDYYELVLQDLRVTVEDVIINDGVPHLSRVSSCTRSAYVFNANQLTPTEAGALVIDLDLQLVDEPYSVLLFPLFDVRINEDGFSSYYNIDKKVAFQIFNTVIEYLSGQNAYLVDAQIYPYCPEIAAVATELQGYPFFQIMSTTFERNCEIQLLPKSDIKKEYIEREYTIISPEQTGRFTFNFYDYVNSVDDNNGVNYAKMNISVKTALKPFAIISSAVIQPEQNALAGITYGSDLRGAQPSSNGFECSLSSNAFEEYKRANSNYQQIFSLQQEELKKQHQVELTNDITSTVINTASATVMGAIAGASLGDIGIGSLFGTKTAGAAAGGAAAGVAVGAAMTAQTIMNSQLRDYEEYLQQQTFDLNIGTIQNLPNSVNRISSFNEIILRDFWYIVEVYECSDDEKQIVDNFINEYGYSIGVFDYVSNYYKEGWFLRSTLVKSNYPVNLHMIAEKELMGGIYLYEQV